MRKRKYRQSKKNNKVKNIQKRKLVFFAFILLAIFTLSLLVAKNSWDREESLAIVHPYNGFVVVSVLVPRSNEIYNIKIPENTQVISSRNLGEWKLGSIWQLGYNEKLKGKLLAETVTKNFYFPTYYWADANIDKLINNSFFHGILGLFYPSDSNLTIGDKVSIFLFSNKVSENNVIEIDLAQSFVLEESGLTDGSQGYKIRSKPQQSLLSLFNKKELVENGRIVQIKDATGNLAYIENVTQILWVLGSNVTSIVPVENIEKCQVEAKNAKSAEIVSRLINCEPKTTDDSEFDLIISLPANHIDNF